MSDAVIVASIGAFASILSVVLAGRANHNAKRSRVQIENDHTDNFREENDRRHKETIGRFGRVDKLLGRVHNSVLQLRSDHSDLAERVHELERIEITNPRPRPDNGK
jgi:hypothetical protein